MKQISISLIIFCCFFQFSHGLDTPESEETQIELLINATKKSVEQLENVKKNLHSFKKQEILCITSPDNGEALFTLSKKALLLITSIHEAAIEPYFRNSFLEELEQLSKAAQNHTIPPILQ